MAFKGRTGLCAQPGSNFYICRRLEAVSENFYLFSSSVSNSLGIRGPTAVESIPYRMMVRLCSHFHMLNPDSRRNNHDRRLVRFVPVFSVLAPPRQLIGVNASNLPVLLSVGISKSGSIIRWLYVTHCIIHLANSFNERFDVFWLKDMQFLH